jgi:hypothetical protein
MNGDCRHRPSFDFEFVELSKPRRNLARMKIVSLNALPAGFTLVWPGQT